MQGRPALDRGNHRSGEGSLSTTSIGEDVKAPTPGPALDPPALPSLLTLIILVIGFRLPCLFLLRYGGAAPDWSDFLYYHELAALAAQGFLPDIHFWVEYPPLFPWLAVGAYRVSLLFPAWTQPYFWFDLLLSGVLAVADAGTIIVIDRLGDLLWGKGGGRRSALLYAALFLPTWAILGWFDTLPTFFLLAGLWFLIRRPAWPLAAGIAAGIGVMFKLFPVLALPAALVVSERPSGARLAWRTVITASASLMVTIAVIATPFYLAGRETFLATFRNVLARGSWTSPWALLDGYYGAGTVASLRDRLFYNASADWGTPSSHPAYWYAAVFLGLAFYLWRFWAAQRVGTPRAAIALTGLGVTLLLLLSKGFSTQFTEWALPFIALLLPGVSGAVLAVLLILNNVVLEGYLYITLFPTHHALLWVSVAVRTVLFLWLALACAAAIAPPRAGRGRRRRLPRAGGGFALLAVLLVAGGVTLGPVLAHAAEERSGDAPALNALRGTPAEEAIVFTSPTAYDRLYRAVRRHPTILVAEPKLLTWTGDRSLNRRLEAGIGDRESVLVVSDAASSGSALDAAVRTWLGARYGGEADQNLGSTRLTRFRKSLKRPEQTTRLTFGDSIALDGYSPPSPQAQPGAPLAITLHWRAAAKIERDYTISLQVLSPEGKLIAQQDAMPVNNTMPTTRWQVGESVYDTLTVDLPRGLTAGQYPLIVVVYDNQNGERLTARGEGSGGDHARLGPVRIAP